MNPRLRLLLAFAIALSGATASAQLFKCTGADGKVAYQDSPCPTTAAQKQMTQIQSDVRDAATGGVALMDVDAAARNYAAMRGAASVLVLYSSKCPLCQQLMPELSALGRDLQGRGIDWAVYSVDALEDQPGLPEFLAQSRAPFSAAAIRPWPSGAITRAFSPLGVNIPEGWTKPFVAVRERSGKVVFQADGVGQLSQVRSALDLALAR
jgi:hypothetical protein